MDLILFIWIGVMGVIPPAIVSAVVGYLLYRYGQKQGQEQYKMVKEEVKQYVEVELPDTIMNKLNGIFGPAGKEGTKYTKEEALQWARQNPGVLSLMKNVAMRGGARYLGKNLFGLTKAEVDTIIMSSGLSQEPTPEQINSIGVVEPVIKPIV